MSGPHHFRQTMRKASRRSRPRGSQVPPLGMSTGLIRRPMSRSKHPSSSLDTTFSALSDPTRRAMIERLAEGELSVSELAKPFPVSLPAISKHLRVLEDAGLLSQERQGRILKCRLEPSPLMTTANWLAQYESLWEKHLDKFAKYLEAQAKEDEGLE